MWHCLATWYPPIGTFIAILGGLGVLMPLFRDTTKIGKREKAVWTFVMFALVLLEIRNLYHDRTDHDAKEAQARTDQLNGVERIVSQIALAKEAIADRLDTTIKKLKQAEAQPIKNSLKVETLRLVKDILQFAGDREKQQPAYSISVDPAERQKESAAFDQWRNETIAEYIRQFDPQIVAVTGRLRAKGIDPSSYLFQCLKPVNTLMITTCGGELQGLADKLP